MQFGANDSQEHWPKENTTMGHGIATIHAKKVRGKMRIIGTGRTNTGQSYIKAHKVLDATSLADKRFKGEAKIAIEEMLAQTELPI